MNDYNYDMIGRYIDGELNAEELNAFEEQLRTDRTLQQEVELYKEIHSTLKIKLHPGENEKALGNTLEEMRGEFFKTKSAKVIPLKRFRWVAMSAAAAFIFAILITMWSPWRKDLYDQYAFVQMPGVEERGSSTDSLLKLASEKFNGKKYEQSLSYFEALLKTDSANSFARYYYAIALLHTNKTEQSRIELTRLYNGNSVFHDDAAFFIALSYLKEKDRSSCKEWLLKISKDAAVHDKAQQLLEKL